MLSVLEMNEGHGYYFEEWGREAQSKHFGQWGSSYTRKPQAPGLPLPHPCGNNTENPSVPFLHILTLILLLPSSNIVNCVKWLRLHISLILFWTRKSFTTLTNFSKLSILRILLKDKSSCLKQEMNEDHTCKHTCETNITQ